MATATLPPSSTACPSASRRASSPATRTADGPMSTPRRDCPRSRGTPITRIFLGEMLENDAVAGVIKFVDPLNRRHRKIPDLFRRSPLLSVGKLRVQLMQHAWKRNRLAHMLQPADPRYGAFDAHAKSGMRHAAELAQIEIPLE